MEVSKKLGKSGENIEESGITEVKTLEVEEEEVEVEADHLVEEEVALVVASEIVMEAVEASEVVVEILEVGEMIEEDHSTIAKIFEVIVMVVGIMVAAAMAETDMAAETIEIATPVMTDVQESILALITAMAVVAAIEENPTDTDLPNYSGKTLTLI